MKGLPPFFFLFFFLQTSAFLINCAIPNRSFSLVNTFSLTYRESERRGEGRGGKGGREKKRELKGGGGVWGDTRERKREKEVGKIGQRKAESMAKINSKRERNTLTNFSIQ